MCNGMKIYICPLLHTGMGWQIRVYMHALTHTHTHTHTLSLSLSHMHTGAHTV